MDSNRAIRLILSRLSPKYPAIAPTKIPIIEAIPMDITPTSTAIRQPCISLDIISSPRRFVPAV